MKQSLNAASIAFALAAAIAAFPLAADSVNTTVRTVTELGKGIYAIRHPDAPDGFPQSNTTVIIGDREVLVVDSCYLPSSAREDIAQIRTWTDKPVRYLVNTHWHYDHTMGNGVYAAEFPALGIIAHRETRKHVRGYNPGWFERFPQRAETFAKRVREGTDIDGKPLSAEDIEVYRNASAGVASVHAEYRTLTDRPPDIGFDDRLEINLGNREVHVLFLGRGNTSGDAVVFLPQEKILVAGDLLDHPVPYLGGGYPVDLIDTLRAMDRLDFETIVPGHGDVLRGRAHLHEVVNLLTTVVAEVEKAIYRIGNGSRNLDEVRTSVMAALDVDALAKPFGGDDKDNRAFFESFSLSGLITAAYAQLWGK